ncbi:hypothetical protein BDZ89DRAFT_1040584 [Hymenopellis radicata]|nr:hypothetical protein BDZ89DRAFT_1040584 [Hymenopellis radicata]
MSRDPSYRSPSRQGPEVDISTLRRWRNIYNEYLADVASWKNTNEYREAVVERFARLVTPMPPMTWIIPLARRLYGLRPLQSTVTDSAGNQRQLAETNESFKQTTWNTIMPIMNQYLDRHNIQLDNLEEQWEIDPETETHIRLQPRSRREGMTLEETYSRGLRDAEQAVLNSHRAPPPPELRNGQRIGALLDRYDPHGAYTARS